MQIKLSVLAVTVRAGARPAPARPAAYLQRCADRNLSMTVNPCRARGAASNTALAGSEGHLGGYTRRPFLDHYPLPRAPRSDRRGRSVSMALLPPRAARACSSRGGSSLLVVGRRVDVRLGHCSRSTMVGLYRPTRDIGRIRTVRMVAAGATDSVAGPASDPHDSLRRPHNNAVNASVRPVTPLASASGAPVHPARYRAR